MKLLSIFLLMLLTFGCGYGSNYNSNTGTPASGNPNIAAIMPNTMAAGSAAFTLTVNGTGFAGNSVVVWNSTNMATSFVSGQQLTAQIPAAQLATAGMASVHVNTPGTGIYANGVNSNNVSFTIQ
jgi:IPT/TIG domain